MNLAGLGFSLLAPTSCALVVTVTGFSGSCPHRRTAMNRRSDVLFGTGAFPEEAGMGKELALLVSHHPLFFIPPCHDFRLLIWSVSMCQSSLISLTTGGMTASRSNDC